MNRTTAITTMPLALAAKPGRLLLYAAAGIAYYAAARVGTFLEFSGPVGSIVWLPAGVGISFLALGGLGLWPAIVVADLLVDFHTALPLGTAFGTTFGNSVEVIGAAWLIRRRMARGNILGETTQVLWLIAALAGGTALSATVGTLSAWIGGPAIHDFDRTVRTFWFGDLSGALVVVPLALAWGRPTGASRWRERRVEAVGLIVGGLALSELALHNSHPIVPVFFPVLIWSALRFGERGATLSLTVVTGLVVWNTTHYHGPFVFQSITRSVLSTQSFIVVAALTTLFLLAIVSEREELARAVATSRTRILAASDRERRRLERNLHDGAQQRLVALAALLHGAIEQLEQEPERTSALLAAAEEQARLATVELRELASGLHPAVLAEFGLAEALRSLARRSSVPIEFRDLPDGRLPELIESTLYYLVVEAVTNAQKHAQASCIWIGAVLVEGRIWLEVADDGIGGAVERPGGGLEGLRDRVETGGGSLTFRSPAGKGTALTAMLPVAS